MIQPDKICYRCMNTLTQIGERCTRCGALNSELKNQTTQLPIGSILAGKYIVGCALGQGGFGVTYVGMELNLETKVAIKEYFPEGFVGRDITSQATVIPSMGEKGAFFQAGRTKFVEEAKTLARFSHDAGIVSVRDFFNENGTAYIVMDYIEGETLKSLAAKRGGKLPAAEVLGYLSAIVDSMAHVHDASLLHRDISPDNIMVKTDGQAVLLDFGAARQISALGEHSNTINVKHGFAPEEQYRTHGAQGPWTDVYALCATIYRLTTGVTPPQAMDRVMSDIPLTPPNALGAGFSPAQQAAIMKGLSVKGQDRQQSMAELKSGLYGTDGRNQPVPDVGAAPSVDVGEKKHRTGLWIGISAAAVAVIAIIASVIAIATGGGGKPTNAGISSIAAGDRDVSSDVDSDIAAFLDLPELSTGEAFHTGAGELSVQEPNFTKGEELYADNNVKLTYYDYEDDPIYSSIYVNLRFTNLSDEEMTMGSEQILVNGIDVNASLYASADGGKTTEATMYLDKSELALAGITQLSEIVFSCTVHDGSYENQYSTGSIEFKNPDAGNYRQEIRPLEVVLHESDDFRITCRPMRLDVENGDYDCLGVCIENGTNDELAIRLDNSQINGQDADAYLTTYNIQPNTIKFCTVELFSSSLEKAAISEGKDILSFDLQITSMEDWSILWETSDIQYHLLSGEMLLEGRSISAATLSASPVQISGDPAEDVGTYQPGGWNGQTYTNESVGISLMLPENWMIIPDSGLKELQEMSGAAVIEAAAGDMQMGDNIIFSSEPWYEVTSAKEAVEMIIAFGAFDEYKSVKTGEQLLSDKEFSYFEVEHGDGPVSRTLVRICSDRLFFIVVTSMNGKTIPDLTALFD